MNLLNSRQSPRECGLLSVEHLHKNLFNVDGPYDGSEEELSDHQRVDGPQHGQRYEQLGEPRRVFSVDQPDVFVQSLVRLPTQRLDVVETAQTLQVWGGKRGNRTVKTSLVNFPNTHS